MANYVDQPMFSRLFGLLLGDRRFTAIMAGRAQYLTAPGE
jgi:hypothetical protein